MTIVSVGTVCGMCQHLCVRYLFANTQSDVCILSTGINLATLSVPSSPSLLWWWPADVAGLLIWLRSQIASTTTTALGTCSRCQRWNSLKKAKSAQIDRSCHQLFPVCGDGGGSGRLTVGTVYGYSRDTGRTPLFTKLGTQHLLHSRLARTQTNPICSRWTLATLRQRPKMLSKKTNKNQKTTSFYPFIFTFMSSFLFLFLLLLYMWKML